MKRQLNLGSIEKHANDHISTCAWIDDMKMLPYNPVLIFKPQGEDQSEDSDNLFLLSI